MRIVWVKNGLQMDTNGYKWTLATSASKEKSLSRPRGPRRPRASFWLPAGICGPPLEYQALSHGECSIDGATGNHHKVHKVYMRLSVLKEFQ